MAVDSAARMASRCFASSGTCAANASRTLPLKGGNGVFRSTTGRVKAFGIVAGFASGAAVDRGTFGVEAAGRSLPHAAHNDIIDSTRTSFIAP